MFSAWRRVDRNARRVVENHGFDGDWRLESLVTMGACLSSREDRVVLLVDRRGPSDFGGSVMSRKDFRSVRKEPTSREKDMRKGVRGENEKEQAVTELVQVQALKHARNTRTAEIQYYYF